MIPTTPYLTVRLTMHFSRKSAIIHHSQVGSTWFFHPSNLSEISVDHQLVRLNLSILKLLRKIS